MCLPLCGQKSLDFHQSWTGLYEGQTCGACQRRMVVDGVYGHPFRLPAGFLRSPESQR